MSWREVPLGRLYRRVERKGRPDLPLLSVYRDLGVVPREGRTDNFNRASEDLSNYKVVKPGDLVLNKMKTWQGSLGVSRLTGIVSPAYFVAERTAEGDDRFLHHLLRSAPLIGEFASRSKGIRPSQWDLPWDEFRSIPVAVPPLAEQRAIAEFLDTETARMDVLIAKKRQLMELLQTLWRNRVRRIMGLLKEEHGVVPLKRVVTCLDGCRVPLSAEERAGRHGPYPYYGASGIIDSVDDFLFDESLVLFGEDGAQLGDPDFHVSFVVSGKVWVNNHAHVLRPHSVDPYFLSYHLATFDRSPHISGGTREKITQDDMGWILVPDAPIEVQKRISLELQERLSATTAILQGAERQIALLQERRQALITAAVTGQLSIPGVAA